MSTRKQLAFGKHFSAMKRLFHGVSILAMLASLAVGGVGCGPEYDRTDFSGTVPDGFGGGISATSLQVHEGMILKSHIVAWNDDNERMPLGIRSLDESIVKVVNVISERDYAFVGLRAGRTQIELTADDEVVLVIEAEVIPQPEPPK